MESHQKDQCDKGKSHTFQMPGCAVGPLKILIDTYYERQITEASRCTCNWRDITYRSCESNPGADKELGGNDPRY